MSVASEIANRLIEMGFSCHPWSGKGYNGRGAEERVYHGRNGYVVVGGNQFGFLQVGLDRANDFVEMAKKVYNEYRAEATAAWNSVPDETEDCPF